MGDDESYEAWEAQLENEQRRQQTEGYDKVYANKTTNTTADSGSGWPTAFQEWEGMQTWPYGTTLG
jgi:hypothetical protein